LITATRRTPPKGRPGTRPGRRVPPPRGSFVDRNRSRLLWAGLVVVTLIAGGFVFASLSQKGYTCLSEWTAPSPAPTAAPGASPQLGFYQDDMGHIHTGTVPQVVKYTFCPPASGPHYNQSGIAGPIQARLYGPNEATVPQNWLHNMEHGAIVILYRCSGGDPGCSDAQQAAFKSFYDAFPNSPVCNFPKGGLLSPVIARFDDMPSPFVAMVWDYVLPLDHWDPQAILDFYNQRAERTNPEKVCVAPTPIPSAGSSTGASPTPAGS
jgi:hypothetical protein